MRTIAVPGTRHSLSLTLAKNMSAQIHAMIATMRRAVMRAWSSV